VRALLAAKADVNAKTLWNNLTALIVASQNGHLEVVRALLAAKADVNVKQYQGYTALMLATQNGHQEVVQLLKSAGATGA
jgi:serine/threonine-protein phosphatase 6 regulatory ankyrin repeat subunit B